MTRDIDTAANRLQMYYGGRQTTTQHRVHRVGDESQASMMEPDAGRDAYNTLTMTVDRIGNLTELL
jgi:hypothetical protein